MKRFLSFDIGTSSVKISLLDIDPNSFHYNLIKQAKYYYDNDRIKRPDLPPNYSQQNTRIIFETIDMSLKCIDVYESKIDFITICGQMHGCVLWNHLLIERLMTHSNQQFSNLDFNLISDNYDWTDGRCDSDFLNTLPRPDCFADQISSGFACATIFWLNKYQPNYLKRFDRLGTVMDLFACLLCGLDKVKISIHNAHSWGYFDPKTISWNFDLLNSNGFPINLLPMPVSNSNLIVGYTQFQWHSIQPNIPVVVSFGDLQSMMHLALKDNPNSIVLNIGTSAQLCYLLDEAENVKIAKKSQCKIKSVDYYPYRSGKYLSVAASLNGGNVLKSFGKFLQCTTKCLTNIDLNEEQIWQRLTDQKQQCQSNYSFDEDKYLTIKPTLFGERYEPDIGSIINVYYRSPDILELTECLCNSLIKNLFNMMSEVERKIHSNVFNSIKTEIICTGSVMIRNPFLKQALNNLLRKIINSDNYLQFIDINYIDCCDAEVGCALLAAKQLNLN